MKNHPVFTLRLSTRSLLFGAVLWFSQPKADSRGESVFSFKNQSWQEADHRIRVDSQSALLETDLAPGTRVKLMGVIDVIAGATPTGERIFGISPASMGAINAVAGASGSTATPTNPGLPAASRPFAKMSDRRKAWSFDLAHQFSRVEATIGFADSRERDYLSRGYSLNTRTDFNQKNTGLLLGYARTDDEIDGRLVGWTKTRSKTGDDLLAGLAQVIDANTTLTANLFYGRSSGFLSDPYKIVSTTKLTLYPGLYATVPENRPTSRNKGGLLVGLNRNFEKYHAAAEGSYRYYHDTFGISSHTLSLLWIQKIGSQVTLQPSLRYYWQSAADFYHYNLDTAGIITTYEPLLRETGTGRAPFYSSDHRLSRMQTIDAGLKVTWQIKPWLEMDAAYNRYTSRGLDQVTPQTFYTQANVFTLGFRASR